MANGMVGWSTTAVSNATQDGINFAEGQLPSTVNDSARGLMASVAKWLYDNTGQITTGGSANAQTATTGTTYTSLSTGLTIIVKAGYSNGGAATLNVDTLGAKQIYFNGSALVGGEIVAGGTYILSYDSTLNGGAGAWRLLNPKVTVDLSGYQPLDATLTALAGVATSADKLIYATGSDTFSTATLTSFVRTLLDDTTAGEFMTTLGISSYAQTLLDDTTAGAALTTLGVSAFAKTILDDSDAAAARTTLGISGTYVATDNGSLAIGSYSILKVASGSVVDGATVAGSSLRTLYWDSSSLIVTSSAPSGTWRNVTGTNLVGTSGLFQRIS